jgi:beta-galactosidase
MENRPPPGARPDWVAANSGDITHLPRPDAKHRGPVQYRVTLPNVPGPNRRLVFEAIYNSGEVSLNGQHLATAGPQPQEISLDAAWSEAGPNLLTVEVTQADTWDGTLGRSYLVSGKPLLVLDRWRMRPGLDLASSGSAIGASISRTTFDYTPDPAHHTVLRFDSKGLSRGLVWLNGICVGRYPQRVPVTGTLLPEPWLKPGRNDLVIVDDQGNAPTGGQIVIEQAASRSVAQLVP